MVDDVRSRTITTHVASAAKTVPRNPTWKSHNTFSSLPRTSSSRPAAVTAANHPTLRRNISNTAAMTARRRPKLSPRIVEVAMPTSTSKPEAMQAHVRRVSTGVECAASRR